MKRYILLGALCALSAVSARADIGDTLKSSQAKYGDPVTGTGNVHEVVYNHNGCQIRHTYNDNGVCVAADFLRLDGKPFSKKVNMHLDSCNLPPMTLNMQSNGWLYAKWDNNDYFRNTVSYTWENGITSYQVIAGQCRYGNDPKWYWNRHYITAEGMQVIRADNATNAEAAKTTEPAEGSGFDPNSKINI